MMRRQNRNPARPGDPYHIRTRIPTEDAFADFVSGRPRHPKVAERRLQRLNEEEERQEQNQHGQSCIVQQQQQLQQTRDVGRVLLGSMPLSQPTPTPISRQSRNLLTPTTGFLTPNDQGSSRPQGVFAQSSEQNFLGSNPFSSINNVNLPSPATPAQAPETLYPDTNTVALNLGSLSESQRELPHAGPSNPTPTLYLSPGVGSQPATPAAPWLPGPGFFIIGRDLVPQRWDVLLHFQLQVSAISPRVVQHHGYTRETGPPSWNNWTIQTPSGLVRPEYFVRGVVIMSTSYWLPIEAMSTDFIVLDLDWTNADVVLARPILTRILQRT
ncbi:hypothetical protein B0J13DRAFT_520545 [Dactylonectria estremocensis]|uniref:Uncharacterized protein n=1 Tax=Dactylonectria estremocensis TaxID=1079267 RepID=A0A9P9FBT7_9HYPO|nr:hypothetical protein B0J13DRAFT_520545 [Dactylonectria estremocensis]